ncbi:phosphopentomutase [Rhodohalobacter sp. SW132]|uniref:phosphopentomutase n=1 Tax=Rhodohalobacter sp. SW132 TaxID=2293433 RepID=UPI000E24BF6D|nr:phosphopentomutase [Rhodohalobacter sp. SW132]REL33564.1 phosphopentomutase [Rhodohalobacter sp. SW132]
MKRVVLLVIDGLGIGAQEDADQYGDSLADTLGHVSEISECELPNFAKLGLGNIKPLASVPPVEKPLASWGKMREVSAGKDSTTGHWELAGIHLDRPFPTFPSGFPESVIDAFCEQTGVQGVLCNAPYSGTDVIRDYGEAHCETGQPIVYTSADSVFQVACHVDVVSVDVLYEWCELARNEIMVGEFEVGRVIARPFTGSPGTYERISDQRRDFSSVPPEPNLLSLLQENGIKTYSIGKVADLFAGNGFTQYRKTRSNAEGVSQLLSLLSAKMDRSFVFTNLIDTDQIYGHRQDPDGYGRALEEIDRAIPALIGKLDPEDLLIITGDHGNDPADDSTDHTREFVPLLVYQQGSAAGGLNIRETFSDVSATTLDFFGISNPLPGRTFGR